MHEQPDGKRVEEHPRGAELDLQMADDREWFERHSERRYRLRFAAPAEVFELEHLGDETITPGTVAVVVAVKRLGPGMRARRICQMLALWAHPDQATDDQARRMFEGCQ
jgi:hypothetical protein